MPAEARFDGAIELLDQLRLSQDRWQIAPERAAHRWLFRGQGNAERSLCPSAFHGLIARPYQSDAAREHTRSELAEVREFLEFADELGILPPTGVDLRRLTAELDAFERGQHDELGRVVEENAEALMLAQHHGVSTRLLDWSTSPMVALYFAAVHALEEGTEVFSVWALATDIPADAEVRILRPTFSANPFALHQKGYMTLNVASRSGYDERDLVSHDRALDDIVSRADDLGEAPRFWKISAPASIAEEVLVRLYNEGISKAHLMPTLDNVLETLGMRRRLSGTRARLSEEAARRQRGEP